MRKECGCIAIEPKHLKVLMGMGARRVKIGDKVRLGSTVEDLGLILDLEEGTILSALDEMLDCEVAQDENVTKFYLTEHGANLFYAIMEAVKEISND